MSVPCSEPPRRSTDPVRRSGVFLLQGGVIPALVDLAQGGKKEEQLATVEALTDFARQGEQRRHALDGNGL